MSPTTTIEVGQPTVDAVVERARILVDAMERVSAEELETVRLAERELRGTTWSPGDAEGMARGLILVPARHLDSNHALVGANGARLVQRRWLRSLRPLLDSVHAELSELLSSGRPHKPRFWLSRRGEESVSVDSANRILRLLDWAEKTGFARDVVAAASTAPGSRAGQTLRGSELTREAFTLLAQGVGAVEPEGVPLLPGIDVTTLDAVAARGSDLLSARTRIAQTVKSAFEAVQDRMVERRLREMKLDTLHGASRGRVRVAPLANAGLDNVQDVLDHASSGLPSIRGMSRQSAEAAVSTAHALRREVRADLKLRIDLDENDRLLSDLIVGLHTLLGFDDRLADVREDLEALVADLEPLRPALASGEDLAVLHRYSPRRGRDVVRFLQARAAWVRQVGVDLLLGKAAERSAESASDAWDDFKKRSPVYYGLLGEIVGFTVDVDAVQGHLPSEVVAAVERQSLDTSLLTKDLRSSLRGYQSFGARYALVQRRVLLGDEMGLGKTIQAIAAMAHLAAGGSRHFVVVCPPVVLVNWIKEIRRHSDLEPHRIHGPEYERARSLRLWRQRGGVAVTSFNLLPKHDFDDPAPAMLVVDEAHFVKNPSAQRSMAVRELVDVSERALFMTGTPLENRVEEFVNLVRMLKEDVLQELDAASMVAGTRRFREAVAPVYLRRNSDDVLSELPDLVQVEEWVDRSRAEKAAYVDAVRAGDFHAMRRVAFTSDPGDSEKLERLAEIVDEAMSNNRKVVVFSYYLDVLRVIQDHLGEAVFGAITGSMSPNDRQGLVDRFTAAARPGVLVSQIVAGGVGINLQAASVVILCEPQVKPSLEDQAIKRAHRMGQVQKVQVHRLLTTDSVDERLLEILSLKAQLFAQFAATSEVADASPEATDITEAELTRKVIALEQERHIAALRAATEGKAPREDAHPSVDGASDEDGESNELDSLQVRARKDAGSAERGPAQAKLRKPPSVPRPPRPGDAPQRFKESLPSDRPRVIVCQSCDRPIDVNGHCGCS